MEKTEVLFIRVSEETKTKLEKVAQEEGRTMSNLARRLIEMGLAKRTTPPADGNQHDEQKGQ